jgi:hypothetical protein
MLANTEQLKIKLNQQADLESEKKNQARLKAVDFLFSNLKCGGEWLKIEGIKLLFFYRDLDIVNERLKEFFKDSESLLIQKALEEFFSGTLNVDDIIAQRKRQMEIKEELRILKVTIRKEEETEATPSEALSFLDLTALKMKDIAIKN